MMASAIVKGDMKRKDSWLVDRLVDSFVGGWVGWLVDRLVAGGRQFLQHFRGCNLGWARS